MQIWRKGQLGLLGLMLPCMSKRSLLPPPPHHTHTHSDRRSAYELDQRNNERALASSPSANFDKRGGTRAFSCSGSNVEGISPNDKCWPDDLCRYLWQMKSVADPGTVFHILICTIK